MLDQVKEDDSCPGQRVDNRQTDRAHQERGEEAEKGLEVNNCRTIE
jgi:hypothetical protein